MDDGQQEHWGYFMLKMTVAVALLLAAIALAIVRPSGKHAEQPQKPAWMSFAAVGIGQTRGGRVQ